MRIVVFLGLASFAAFAKAHPISSDNERGSIEEVEVHGHHANLIGDAISASEGTITRQDLAIRPILRTGEVLEAVPGLVATQHSGSGKANQYFLRGFNLDHGTDFATSIDGMPINMRAHGHGQGYTDLSFLIPELIDSITYRKGPYYAGVGDFSGAGSAQISTAEQLEHNSVSLGVGAHDFYRGLFIGDAALAQGNFVYGLEYQTYDGHWDYVSEDAGKTNVWLKQAWLKENLSLDVTLMAYDNSWNSADQIPRRAVESGLISDLGSIDTTVGGESSRYSLSTFWQYTRERNRIEGHVYAIDYDMQLWSNFSYFTDPAGDQFQQVDSRTIWGGDWKWAHESMLGNRAMVNTLGVETRFDDIDEVGLKRTVERQPIGVIRTDAVEEWSSGIYWQNKLALATSLRSVFGLRYDYFNFNVIPLEAAEPNTLELNGGEASADITTASWSLIYTPSDDQEIYASVGQGFHSNDARGTTIAVDPITAEPLDPVDPLVDTLDPVDPLVDTLGYELGWRGVFGDWLNTSIALWKLDIDSELLYVGDEGVTEDTGIGSSRNGVEITSYYRPSESWTLDLEYAYSNAEFDEPIEGSTDVPGALEQVATAGVNWSPTDHFFAHLRVRYFSEYPLDGGAVADAGTLVNLRLGYEISGSLHFTLDILNLFNSNDHDVEYFYESQLPGEDHPVADYHYHVFEPRTAKLHAEYRF